MKVFSSILFSLALLLGVGFTLEAHAQVAGCTSTSGYNTATGMSCNGATTIPMGCSSTAGFSASTGMPCNGAASPAANGYNGVMVGQNGYLNGCTSTSGYSATTGSPCNMAINGVIYTGNGTTVNTGLPTTPVVTTNPGLPTTGAGTNAFINVFLLLSAGLIAFFGFRYSFRHASR